MYCSASEGPRGALWRELWEFFRCMNGREEEELIGLTCAEQVKKQTSDGDPKRFEMFTSRPKTALIDRLLPVLDPFLSAQYFCIYLSVSSESDESRPVICREGR